MKSSGTLNILDPAHNIPGMKESDRDKELQHIRDKGPSVKSEALVTKTLVPINLKWAVSSFRQTWNWC